MTTEKQHKHRFVSPHGYAITEDVIMRVPSQEDSMRGGRVCEDCFQVEDEPDGVIYDDLKEARDRLASAR